MAAAALAVSFFVVAPGASPVRALAYPAAREFFAVCSTADQEFCIEALEFTPANGTKRTIADPSPAMPGSDPYVQAFLSAPYSGPSSLVSGGYPPSISINYYDPNGMAQPTPPLKTAVGLADGVYRVVMRTGDFDPTYMLLTGKFDSYSVSKGADGNWTVDLSARPMPTARVVVMDGNQSMLNTCQASNWLGDCEANFAYQGYILASFAMLADPAQRESGRGMWISSNASVVGMGSLDFLKGEIKAEVKSPHYVPTDFPTAGLTAEGSRHLNPAFYETFIPYTMMTKMLGQMSGKDVTVDQVKSYLSKPTEVMEGSIKEAASASASPVDKVQSLTTTAGETGVRVNFNLTHYSSPDPSLKMKLPPALSSTAIGNQVLQVYNTGAAAARTAKKLANGAKLSIAKSAVKGKSVTGKSLLSPTGGATVAVVTSKSKSVCTVKGTTVKMVKAGSCKLSATVKLKGKASTVSFTVKVA